MKNPYNAVKDYVKPLAFASLLTLIGCGEKSKELTITPQNHSSKDIVYFNVNNYGINDGDKFKGKFERLRFYDGGSNGSLDSITYFDNEWHKIGKDSSNFDEWKSEFLRLTKKVDTSLLETAYINVRRN